MTDPLLNNVVIANTIQSDPGSGSFNYIIIRPSQVGRSPTLQFRGGSYYYGRIEFQDENSQVKAVIRSDASTALRFDMMENPLGIMITRSGGIPVNFFTPNSELRDASYNLMIGPYGLGPRVVSSSLTSVGTLSSLAVNGDCTLGNVKINNSTQKMGINVTNPQFSLDIVGDCNITGAYKLNGTDLVSETALASSIKSSSLESLGTLGSLSVIGDSTITGSINCSDTITTNNMVIHDFLTVGDPEDPLDVLGLTVLSKSSFQNDLNAINVYAQSVYTSGSYKIDNIDVLTSDTLGIGIVNSSLTSVGQLNSLTVIGDVNIDSNTLVVDSVNNRVGVLAATPSYPFVVIGSSGLNVDTNGNVGLGQNPGTYKLSVTGQSSFYGSVGITGNFRANTTGIYCPSATKYVGIGTDVPTVQLDVNGDMLVSSKTIGNNVLVVKSTNELVGIRTASPQYPLHVTGDINTSTFYRVQDTNVLSKTTLGSTVLASSLTSVGTLSSLNVSGTVTFGGLTPANGGFSLCTGGFSFATTATGATDPDPGYPRDIKCQKYGIAVVGGTKTDTLSLSGLMSSTNTTAPSTASHIGYSTLESLNTTVTVVSGTTYNLGLSLGPGVWNLYGQFHIISDDNTTSAYLDKVEMSFKTDVSMRPSTIGNKQNYMVKTIGRNFAFEEIYSDVLHTTVFLSATTSYNFNLKITTTTGTFKIMPQGWYAGQTNDLTYFRAIRIA